VIGGAIVVGRLGLIEIGNQRDLPPGLQIDPETV
jgi:hypothetical protein